jgi:RNA polymerase sigma-70 factor (ECF subfamily)
VGEQLEPRSDEELMLAYVAGDRAAFEELFERYRRLLFTFLLHQTGDRLVAEDLFQEVFLRVIRARKSFRRGGGPFKSWLMTIARNAVIDMRRRAAVRRDVDGVHRQDPERGRAEERIADHKASGDPHQAAEIGHIRRRIVEALGRLPDEQREVFLLREQVGLDFGGIAELTGCKVATAKSRMRYALEGLRRQLADVLSAEPSDANG